MPCKWRPVRGGATWLVSVLLAVAATNARAGYPPTPRRPHSDTLHGQTIVDPYRWLEDGNSPPVQEWTAAQNAYAEAQLGQFADKRASLVETLLELYRPDIASAPAIFGERYFFLKRAGIENHARLYMQRGGPTAEPELVLNPNSFSADGTAALDWWFPSPDGRLIAFGRSTGGSEQSTLRLLDVDAGELRTLAIPRTQHISLAWDADSAGFTYTRYPMPGSVPADEEHYHRHIYYHRLGTDWRADPKIWGAGRPKEETANIYNDSGYRHQFLTVWHGWDRNDLFVRPMGQGDFRPVAVGLDALTSADVLGDDLLLLTTHAAPRGRIVAAPLRDPRPENWRDVIPQQQGVIEEFALADGALVVRMAENAYSRLLLHEPGGKLIKEIVLPTLGHVSQIQARPGQRQFYFRFESFAHPPVIFAYDLREHTMTKRDVLAVPLDLSVYETRQVWFNSRDGTRVPMFVTARRDLTRDGRNPTVLYGYGGFNISQTPRFRREVLPWLAAGGVWAVANVRGGGEFGNEWHRAGQLENKQNVFDDFMAAAETLIAEGYTTARYLGAQGASNGGLLVGAMIVQRPELFRAVHCDVPLLDMLRYHRFSIGRLWIPEYGSAENVEEFAYLQNYSPYHHVAPDTPYPAVLITTGTGDTRVAPLHARKMTAALQSATSAPHPILLSVTDNTGHGPGTPLRAFVEQQADVWTFFMWQLGVFERGTATQPTTAPSKPAR